MTTAYSPRPMEDDAHLEPFVVTRKEVSAAKLRIDTDRRLGRETPDWIKRVAEAKRAS
ncbi:hypothetical protein [Georgenia subflava]|uniref:hypothetical protein n=1 Tax=Georgenia subflava TaxID=1622177 RepID=UPI00186AFED6|nr:hypothetical protein [Georgenia subflava]